MNTRFGCWARRAKPCLFAHLTTSVVTAGPLNLLVHGDESAVEDRRKPHRKRRQCTSRKPEAYDDRHLETSQVNAPALVVFTVRDGRWALKCDVIAAPRRVPPTLRLRRLTGRPRR